MRSFSLSHFTRHPATQRWIPLIVVVGTLLVLGFYTVTDPERLPHAHELHATDYVGAAFCHRIPSRSFLIAGRPMAFCSRCTGMYLGAFGVFLVIGLSGRWRWSELPRLPILLVLLGFVGIMGIDGINSFSHFFPNLPRVYTPRNWLRLVTGIGTGLALGSIIFPALAQTLWRDQILQPVVNNWRELFGIVLVGGVFILLTLSNQPTILYVLSLASAAGILLIVASLNTIVLLIVIGRDARAVHGYQIILPLLVGFALAIAEIWLIVALRLEFFGTISGVPGL